MARTYSLYDCQIMGAIAGASSRHYADRRDLAGMESAYNRVRRCNITFNNNAILRKAQSIYPIRFCHPVYDYHGHSTRSICDWRNLGIHQKAFNNGVLGTRHKWRAPRPLTFD